MRSFAEAGHGASISAALVAGFIVMVAEELSLTDL